MLGTRYLGDGVYVKQDGYGIKLYTSDGRDETNVIFIEPAVWLMLSDYVKECGDGGRVELSSAAELQEDHQGEEREEGPRSDRGPG